jgi:Fe2+ or Zn2+ uptake regulation protein
MKIFADYFYLQMSCIYVSKLFMEENDEYCDAYQSLKDAGLNKTPQRVAVLNILIHSDRPISAGDILRMTTNQEKINKVTVHRILSCFKKRGIIREIPTGDGTNYYEMACHHSPVHAHFYCTSCKTLTCLEPLTVSQTWNWLAKPHNFTIEGINVSITGLCKNCQKAQSN